MSSSLIHFLERAKHLILLGLSVILFFSFVNFAQAAPSDDFVITVKTDNPGTSSNTQYTIPAGIYFSKGPFNYNVDCNNDGINEIIGKRHESLYTCNYPTPGVYTIRIKDNTGQGTGFPFFLSSVGGDKLKIVGINQWGTLKWVSFAQSFGQASNLSDVGGAATDAPNLSNVTDMQAMFRSTLFNQNISDWDTSNITDMRGVFAGTPFNQDIGDWNTSKVTRMDHMFEDTQNFNQNISNWDVSKVTQMQYMFNNADSFNQNLGNWNPAELTYAWAMFRDTPPLSTENYDALLQGWSEKNLQPNVEFNVETSKYCHAEAARNKLINVYGWKIIDAGRSSQQECQNVAPEMQSIGNKTVNSGENLFFDVTATDIDGDNLKFAASGLPNGATFSSTTGEFSWTPAASDVGEHTLTFTVTENTTQALSDSENISITVASSNVGPEINPIDNQTTTETQPLTFIVEASDPDNDLLTLSADNLPSGASFNSSTGEFTWTPDFSDEGTYEVTFTATEDTEEALSASTTVIINVINFNRAPELTPIGNQTVDEGETLEFTVSATDADNDDVTLSALNLPTGATFTPSTGLFTWNTSFSDAGNYENVEFTAADNGTPMELDVELITITVGNVNRLPEITNPGPQSVFEEETVSFSVSATDPDNDVVTLSASSLPSGATFNASTGEFEWETSLSDSGIYTVTITATDNGSPAESASTDVVITVGDNPTPVEQAEDLIEAVVILDLPNNVENSYMANLQKVGQFIAEGKINPAINQLNAFINKITQHRNQGILTQAEYESLLAMAEGLIEDLEG